MARRRDGVEEIFGEAALDAGWSKKKQVEILLGFVETHELEAELAEYLEEVVADDDTEEVEADPFNSDFSDDE